MDSAVCIGWIRHVRFTPRRHAFRYRMSMLYLELGRARRTLAPFRLWSYGRPNIAAIRREDHLGEGHPDLETAARDLVEARTGRRPTGPIGLLAQPRYFGYCFNPISLFLCWDSTGTRIETLIIEVHNTPWGERIAYVEPAPAPHGGTIEVGFDKQMHVSPFLPMDMRYRLRLRTTGGRLSVTVENFRQGRRVLSACLATRRTPIARATLARALLATPLMTAKIWLAIHFQALRIWLKGVPYISYPGPHNKNREGLSS